ncbi:hypothetical protein JHK87_012221 [Glycine soja]|nr:hypothetical protein JHK87_012221 [Glycine soja]
MAEHKVLCPFGVLDCDQKVIRDCKRDSEAMYFQFAIKLNNVVDMQIAYSLIDGKEQGQKVNEYIPFVDLLADPHYCGVAYQEVA